MSQTTIVDKKPRLGEILKNRDFSAIFLGGLISDLGSNFAFIAILFLAINFTDHLPDNEAAQAVALILVIQLIPSLIIGPFAGVIVDRFDRKKIMAIADIMGALSSLGAILAVQISHLYLVSLASSLTRLFFYPARGASIPRIVEPDQLLQANGITQTMAQLSGLIGPGIAGIVAFKYGLRVAFIVDGASYLISALMILTISTNLKPQQNEGKVTTKSLLKDMYTGLKIVVNDKVIRYVLILFLFLLLGIGMVNPLLAFYLESTFNLTAKDFGFLASFSAISGVIGAVLITIKGDIKRKLTLITSSSIIIAIALSLMGYASMVNGSFVLSYWIINIDLPYGIILLYTSMAFIGIVNVSINVPLSSLMQGIIEDANLGKVGAFFGTALSFAQVASSSTAAILVIFLPVNMLFIVIGGFTLVVGLIGFVFLSVRKMEKIAQTREAENIEIRMKAREEMAKIQTQQTSDKAPADVVPS